MRYAVSTIVLCWQSRQVRKGGPRKAVGRNRELARVLRRA